ncbi:hypothetical protein J2T08_006052 [Neorhizobium galegae]|uniref:hypothetical protein n=1 Tax=Neorhizobium galegae TaxID=399 RepID=UPI00277F4989|nr:hypothetical protein [Neorhizobium galegae]MDQ0138107.1 hypothetical protein [Neorhizobium galegae]
MGRFAFANIAGDVGQLEELAARMAPAERADPSTSMAIRPGTDELLIFTNDWGKGRGSTIFIDKALAKAAE